MRVNKRRKEWQTGGKEGAAREWEGTARLSVPNASVPTGTRKNAERMGLANTTVVCILACLFLFCVLFVVPSSFCVLAMAPPLLDATRHHGQHKVGKNGGKKWGSLSKSECLSAPVLSLICKVEMLPKYGVETNYGKRNVKEGGCARAKRAALWSDSLRFVGGLPFSF